MALQTQHRVSNLATPVSYFNSQSQQTPTSYLSSVPSSSPTMLFKRPQQAQRGQSYSLARKQKETEAQVQSSERMTSLHSRLQQEAEKIRKWKNAIELDTKHKEKCLEESNVTVEKQQKVITDLQLKNEALQVQLDEEVANQKEIKTKISATREMCTALKDHCVKINATLAKGQEDKEKLVRLNQERVAEYQALREKYEELEKNQEHWHKSYNDALLAEKMEKDGLLGRNTQLLEDLEVCNNKNKSLEGQVSADEASIATLKEKLGLAQDDAKSLSKDLECLQDSLSVKDRQITAMLEAAGIHEKEFASLTEKSEKLDVEVTSVKESLKKEQDVHQDEVANLEHELERLDSEWNAKCSCLSSKLKLTENSLEETVSCRDNIAAQLEEKVKTCNSLKEELTATRESCTALEGWKQQILQEAKQLKQQLRLAQEEVDTQRGDKERDLDKAEKLISELVSRHDNARDCWKEKERELEARLTDLDREKVELIGKGSSLSQALRETEAKLEESVSLAKDMESKYEARVKLLTSELEEVRNDRSDLRQEVEVLSRNKENLALLCSNQEGVVQENLSLKGCLEISQTQMKQLQDKMTAKKEAAQKEAEKLKFEIQALTSEVSTCKSNEATERQKHVTELKTVRGELEGKVALLNVELEKVKIEAETAKQDFVRGKKDCDREVQDLVAAMDSYRSEHERTMAVKEKVVENLKLQLQQNRSSKETAEQELELYKGQLQQLRSDLEKKNSEIKGLVSSMEGLTHKLEENGREIDKKDKEIQVLKTTAGAMSQKAEDLGSSEVVSTTPSKKKTARARSTPRVRTQKPSTTTTAIEAEPPTAPSNISSLSIPPLKDTISSSNLSPLHPTTTTTTTTTTTSSHIFKTPAMPTPGRLYSYHAKATPLHRSKAVHITPRSSYSGRGKRMRCPLTSECVSSGGTDKENTSRGTTEDEEVVLKKQKTKNARVTVQHQVSSTTTRKRATAKKPNKEDLSWFELDSVYGFGTNDY